MTEQRRHEWHIVAELRAHEEVNRGTKLGNIAGNSADIIASLLREVERMSR